MEILQKEVDTRAANIENVPSNYSEQSFDSRTYTQLDSSPNATTTNTPSGPPLGTNPVPPPPPPPLLPSTPAAMAIAQANTSSPAPPAAITTSTYTARGHCMYPGMEQYIPDASSEYSSYGEMKYSHQMAAAAAARVPYPSPYYPTDQFSEQDWQYGSTPDHAWQPSSTTTDFHAVNTSSPPTSRPHTTLTPSSVQTSVSSSTSTLMHQHPAFLQVEMIFGSLVCHA